MYLLLAIPLFIVFLILFRKEPRSIWPGVAFTFALFAAVAGIVLAIAMAFSLMDGAFGTVVVIVIILTLAASPLILGGFLATNMAIVWRREGPSPAALVSGAVGIALFVYTGFFYVAILSQTVNRETTTSERILVGMFPMVVYAGLAFVSFITYTVFYEWYFTRFGRRADAVIVLGAQVRDPDELTPLLRSRVDRGIEVANKAIESGKDTVLVFSGGQGPDEPCPEGLAMANYARSQGVADERIIVEDRSTTTEENLAFSSELLRQRESFPDEPWIAVATSDYHAFRGAILMRKAGLDGYATGARTARYFWPSAKVREFFAIVVDHKWPVLAVAVLAVFAGILMGEQGI
nr:YdcF family protein [Corynebacterium lactis]